MTKAWLRHLRSVYRQRGLKLRIRPPVAGELEDLRAAGEVPESLLALFRITNGLEEYHGKDEFGCDVEHPLLQSAKSIAADWKCDPVLRATPPTLIRIGRRGGPSGVDVHFVMEPGTGSRRVGIYVYAYDRLEWRCASLEAWLEGLAAGTVATDAEISRIDPGDDKAKRVARRRRRAALAAMRARRRNLPAPARPADWRAHIARAFNGFGKVSLRRPLRDARTKLLSVCRTPPRVLVDVLRATNGLHDDGAYCWILFSAANMVARTREARTQTTRLEELIVIGAPGVDGICFVMQEGANSNGVGAYYPIDDAVRWLCPTLSEFLNRYAEDSLPF